MTRNDLYNKLPAGTVNKQGFVVDDTTPFLNSKGAIDWAILMNTENVRYDPVLCRQLAIAQRPGIRHMFLVAEAKRNEVMEKIKRTSEECAAIPNDSIMNAVNIELLRRKLDEMIGRHSGLGDTVETLREREYELYRCARIEVNDK